MNGLGEFMKVVFSILLMFSTVAFSRGVYVEEKEGKLICTDKEKEEPKVIYRNKVFYKNKIIYKDKVVYKDRVIYKDKVKTVYKDKIIERVIEKPTEKVIDNTKKNNVSLLIGFPLDYYNYEAKKEFDKIKYPIPGLSYTRTTDAFVSFSLGFALKTGFIGAGYSF